MDKALELADKLETEDCCTLDMEAVADMLRQQQAEIEALKAAVCSFFNDYLDQREESDSGRVFAPIYISNCRCMTLDPMSKLMNEMRELSGAKPPPKMET